MRPFIITYTGKLIDLFIKAGLEYLSAGRDPHPITGKVDPCHPHIRFSAEHDAFIHVIDNGVILVYPDSTMSDTDIVLRNALKPHCVVRDIDKFLAMSNTAIAEKVAPYPLDRDDKPDLTKSRVLCICKAGDNPVELVKTIQIEVDEKKGIERI